MSRMRRSWLWTRDDEEEEELPKQGTHNPKEKGRRKKGSMQHEFFQEPNSWRKKHSQKGTKRGGTRPHGQ